MRQPKIDRRRRYAEWVAACPERADLWKASPDAKWYLMREWSNQKPPIGHQEIGDRLKVSRQCVQLQLQYALPPSERVRAVVPPLLPGVISRRRLVDKLAQVVHGEPPYQTCKFPTAEAIAVEILRRTEKQWDTSTIRRDLAALGYRLVTKPRTGKAKGEYSPFTRKVCCENLLACVKCEWLIYTDEKYFDSNDHGVSKQYVKPGQKPLTRIFTPFCVTSHFWAAIGKGFKLLIELPAEYRGLKANSTDYIRTILGRLF